MPALPSQPISADRMEYNHDIDVSPAYAARFPLIKDVLRDETLIQAFKLEDAKAKACKNNFVTWGGIAVILGILPLLFAPFAIGFTRPSLPAWSAALAFDACGVVSLVLIIIVRIRQYRDRWRRAVFARERMRQWHFQLFLDGQFIQLASTNPHEFHDELENRWVQFKEGVAATHNNLQTFINDQYKSSDLYVVPSPYTNSAVADQVWRALSHVRFAHQAGYTGIQLDPNDAGRLLPTPKKRQLLEAVAAGSLLVAILVTVAFFCIDVAVGLCRRFQWSDAMFLPLPMFLLRIAVFFTALSAGSRAYKAGLTLPEEIESYEHYQAEVVQLKRLYDATTLADQKRDILADLEREASQELRRFLKMKGRATFII